MESILHLECEDVKKYFLSSKAYCAIHLPDYFDFTLLLQKIEKVIEGKNLSSFFSQQDTGKCNRPENFENVNYCLYHNKNGDNSWRKIEIINPAIYVALVQVITEKSNWNFLQQRFSEFSSNHKIKCISLPIEYNKLPNRKQQILSWWQNLEQESIILSLEYSHLIVTDISDCYSSIYTHSIAWAVDGKDKAKASRGNNSSLGNTIDTYLRSMCYGQTNGIPQGSILMDFIAEIVLGYIDKELSDKLKQSKFEDYQILRYRDDYRIFTKNEVIGKKILKLLSETLIEFGLKLNVAKTKNSHEIICNSIKSDKLFWLSQKKGDKNLLNHLLLIYKLSKEYPNSGSIVKALMGYNRRISKVSNPQYDIKPIIAIIVQMVIENPRIYPQTFMILSKSLGLVKTDNDKIRIINALSDKISTMPNSEMFSLWFQRIKLKLPFDFEYISGLCNKVIDDSVNIWNTEWLADNKLKKIVDNTSIINEKIMEELTDIISAKEMPTSNYE